MLREGLGFDKCDVAVVTNAARPDHLGPYFMDSADDMYKVKRAPVDVVMPSGFAVLNATDPLCVRMESLSSGGVIFFARDPANSVVTEHLAAGKRAVTVRNNVVTLCAGADLKPLLPLNEIHCTHDGRVGFQIENVLAAAAAAWGLGIPLEAIRAGLLAFRGNLYDDPARFNLFEVSGKTILLADCRNPAALAAIIEATSQFPHGGRSVVYSADEDRRDVEILEQAQLLGDSFTRVYLWEPTDMVSRSPGQMTSLLARSREGTSAKDVQILDDWGVAVDAAWRDLGKGELLVIQSAALPVTVRKIQSLVGLDRIDSAVGTAIAG